MTVLNDGFAWNGTTYGSLSRVAKAIAGTSWNGHRFFGLKAGRPARPKDGAGEADKDMPKGLNDRGPPAPSESVL